MMAGWFGSELSADEERAVGAFMGRLARATLDALPRLPEADVLLVKAQLLRRWEAERKVQAPLDVMEPVQVVAGLAAAALLLIWAVPSLLRLLPELLG